MNRVLILAYVVASLGLPAMAGDLTSRDDVLAALSGNTVMGTMQDGTAYAEFYDANGTIRAAGYTGYWGVVGNSACFSYELNTVGCWQMRVDGNYVIWMRDGKDDGSGSLLPGNPNNF